MRKPRSFNLTPIYINARAKRFVGMKRSNRRSNWSQVMMLLLLLVLVLMIWRMIL